MNENLTEVRGLDLKVGDDLEFLGKAHRILSFTAHDPTRCGLPAEDGWRTAHSVEDWGMTIDPRGTYRIYAS